MFYVNIIIFHCVLCVAYCDWVSEWMSPVQEQLHINAARRSNGGSQSMYNDEDKMGEQVKESPDIVASSYHADNGVFRSISDDQSSANLKRKLERTLQSATALSSSLKTQIIHLTAMENVLKEAITTGSSGVSTVTVTTISQMPRWYIIRDGSWSLCNGMIQYPAVGQSTNLFNGLFAAPRCLGREIPSRRDPCVFNSVIKYETVPTQRSPEYIEDDFVCLMPSFNTTFQQYLSVTRGLINETCRNGIVRSVGDNIQQCGLRIMSDYTYYPHRSSSSSNLPLEYCTERDGSCKLIMAWHVSNYTIESFEFLKNEKNFKDYFIKAEPYAHVI